MGICERDCYRMAETPSHRRKAAGRLGERERIEPGPRHSADSPHETHVSGLNRWDLVRAEGLEPSRGLRPNGFSYPLRLSPPCRDRVLSDAPAGLWSGLYLHHGRSAVGAARLVSTPSRPECSVRAWLGIAISQGSPNLSSSASPVSRRALKLRLSPMRLPIPPRPRGRLQYKAHVSRRGSFAGFLDTFFLPILTAAASMLVLMCEA